MGSVKKYIDVVVVIMMFVICAIFSTRGCSVNQDLSENNEKYQKRIDSLNSLTQNLRDSIEKSNDIIIGLKEMERVLYSEIANKERIISTLKSNRDEKINVINNGSYSDSYNRVTGRYSE